jgi:hypothetical protein
MSFSLRMRKTSAIPLHLEGAEVPVAVKKSLTGLAKNLGKKVSTPNVIRL